MKSWHVHRNILVDMKTKSESQKATKQQISIKNNKKANKLFEFIIVKYI